MSKLLGVDIAKILNAAMGHLLTGATLRHYTNDNRTPGSLTAGLNPNFTTHTCRGFVETYKDYHIDGTIIQRGDRKVTLLGESIAPAVVPVPNDEVTIDGSIYRIVNVDRDPASATYGCQARH